MTRGSLVGNISLIMVVSISPVNSKKPNRKRRSSLLTALKNEAKFGPPPSLNPPDLVFGVPEEALKLYKEARNVTDLYDWQKDCLGLAQSSSQNLLVTLPTSGGKSLIADLLILHNLLVAKKDCILILPFVSIVQEKMKSLVPIALKLDILVEEYAGCRGRIPPIRRRRKSALFVATIEKASSLINSMIEMDKTSDLGLVVVDELHMIGDGASRGVCLEQSIIKLKNIGCTRLVGLSATLGNAENVRSFMDAQIFDQSFRPVELTEYVKHGNTLYSVNQSCTSIDDLLIPTRKLTRKGTSSDPDQVLELVLEVIPQSSCLIFCSTKRNTENVALMMAQNLPKNLKLNQTEFRIELLRALKEECDGKLCPVLKATVPYGVAYHHSGLTGEERRLIQDAYIAGILNVICCTSTLAAGVNLPARRVIIRTAYVGRELLTRQQYKQMSGRAGRAGLDETGESIVIVQSNNQAQFLDRLLGDIPPCRSGLMLNDAIGVKTLVLCCLCLKLIETAKGARDVIAESLLSTYSDCKLLDEVVNSALDHLVKLKLIKIDGNVLSATPLGVAAHKGCISLDIACTVYVDMYQPLRQGFVLSTYMHMIYCVVPYEAINETIPNWQILYNIYCDMDLDERRVFELVSVTEGTLVRRLSNCIPMGNTNQAEERTLKRLYLCCILNKLWKCEPLWVVADTFRVPRGWLQNLLQSAASFASCLSRFCQHLPDLWPYQSLLPDFVKRLSHCTVMELIPLMDIQGVKQARARQLYTAGYRNLGDVASSDINVLVEKIEHLSKKQARQIIDSAKMQLKEELAVRADEMAELLGNSGNGLVDSLMQLAQ